jgi:hypothetical protein
VFFQLPEKTTEAPPPAQPSPQPDPALQAQIEILREAAAVDVETKLRPTLPSPPPVGRGRTLSRPPRAPSGGKAR